MKKRFAYFAIPLMIFSCQSAVAEQPADRQQPKWYQVEMIVFTHPAETENAVLEDSHILSWKGIPTGSIELADDPSLLDYQRLSPSDFLLKSEERRLGRREGYQVHLHIAWQQPGLDAKSARPVHIFGGQAFFADGQPARPAPSKTAAIATGVDTELAAQEPDDNSPLNPALADKDKLWEIEGTVKIVKDRFFDILTQLRLLQPTDHWERPYNTLTRLESDNPSIPAGFTQLAFRQSQRMRSNQLNYLDHPQLGVLIKIIPIDTPTTTPTNEVNTDEPSTTE